MDTNGKLVVPCEYDEADVVYKFGIPIAELYNRKDGKFNYLIKKLDDNKVFNDNTLVIYNVYNNYDNLINSFKNKNISFYFLLTTRFFCIFVVVICQTPTGRIIRRK